MMGIKVIKMLSMFEEPDLGDPKVQLAIVVVILFWVLIIALVFGRKSSGEEKGE